MSVWWGPEWTLIYNDAYAPLLAGRHPDALAASAKISWADVWPAIGPQLEAVLRGKPSLNVRTLVPTNRNGRMEDAWFTWAYTPIIGHDGKIEGSFVVCTEDTVNVLRERQLLETQDRLALTLSAADIGYWSLDALTGKAITDANLAAVFALPPEIAAAGAPLHVFTDAIHEEDRARTVAAIKDAMENNDTFEAEYRLAPKNESVRWVLARGAIIRDDQGRTIRMSGVLIDITERVRAEQRLRAAETQIRAYAQELELKVEERTQTLRQTVSELETFSYSISHDLRAPLRAMQSFARILEEDCGAQVNESGKDYIRRIVASADRMDRLIQDVLVYSRMAPASMELETVDTQSLVEGILESYPQFHDTGIRVRISGRMPMVRGNATALTQCFTNLLNNGIKFSRPGVNPEIDVSAERVGQRVRISFRDNGVGIPRNHWGKIFGLYYRVDQTTEGTGIGLAIVKKAIERMGGTVELFSEVGQGSVFHLELDSAEP